ncbi:MAG: hypothetical protein RIA09_19495 [Hoeflea sp.]|uniref:hypothetical protein n=1 Tax=Hoeflea sp. TaxID=1940281 RepID=UPI0032ED287A
MASILKFEPRSPSQAEAKAEPEGCVVAMKHVDLDVVNDLMRLFRKMDEPEYRQEYVKARVERRSNSADSIGRTEKN